jgi:hypothetical protein
MKTKRSFSDQDFKRCGRFDVEDLDCLLSAILDDILAGCQLISGFLVRHIEVVQAVHYVRQIRVQKTRGGLSPVHTAVTKFSLIDMRLIELFAEFIDLRRIH